MNSSIFFAIVLQFSMMTLVGQSEKAIYSQSVLSSSNGVRNALVQKYPRIERIYEFFDKKNSREIAVYFDKKSLKAIVIFGGNGLKVKCTINDKDVQNLSDIFEPEQVLAFAQNVHYSNNGDRKVIDDKNTIIKLPIGYSFRRPKSGSLKISLSSSNGEFVILWQDKSDWPDVRHEERDQG